MPASSASLPCPLVEQNIFKCSSSNVNKTYHHVFHLSIHLSEQLQKKKYAFDVYLKIVNYQPRFRAVLTRHQYLVLKSMDMY